MKRGDVRRPSLSGPDSLTGARSDPVKPRARSSSGSRALFSYRSSRNCSTDRPASRAMPPMVKSVYGIVARNGHDALAIAHNDVLALSHHPKARLFQGAYGV